MKKFFIIFIFFLVNYHLFSQNGIRIDTFNLLIDFEIENNSENFKVINQHQDTIVDLIQPFNINIQDADLYLTPSLKKLKRKEKYFTFLSIKNSNGYIINPPPWELSNNDRTLKKKNSTNIITWKNITEGTLIPENQYTLNYRVYKTKELVACEKDYQFTFRKHLPYLSSILLGGALLLSSENHLTDSNKYRALTIASSNKYLTLWENGNSEQQEIDNAFNTNNSNFTKAETFYNQYQQKAIFGYIAIGVGVSGYITHLIINKRNQKNKNKYCKYNDTPIQIDPLFSLNLNGDNPIQQLGLNLTYTF